MDVLFCNRRAEVSPGFIQKHRNGSYEKLFCYESGEARVFHRTFDRSFPRENDGKIRRKTRLGRNYTGIQFILVRLFSLFCLGKVVIISLI